MRTAFSCPCGVRFGDLKCEPASKELLAFGKFIKDRLEGLTPEFLDKTFVDLPASDLISVAHVIGLAKHTPREQDKDIPIRASSYANLKLGDELSTVKDIIPVIEGAMPFLLDFDREYPKLLADVAGRNNEHGCDSMDTIFATTMGRALRRPPRGIDKIPIESLTEAVEQFCLEKYGIKRRKPSVRRNSLTARKIEPHTNCSKIATGLSVPAHSAEIRRIYEDVVRDFDMSSRILKESAEDLAKTVTEEVSRRWENTNSTLSLDGAMKRICHPLSTPSPDDWIHEKLLQPVDAHQLGIDQTLDKRRNGKSFLAADVEVLRNKMHSHVEQVASKSEMAGFELFRKCRKHHGGGWPRTQFILSFLEGEIPARSLKNEPLLTDIWFHLETVRDLSLEHRVKNMIEKDIFMVANRCRNFMTDLWDEYPTHLSDYHLRNLRRINGVRFTDVRNTTEGRDRPLYHYSMIDLIERGLIIQGNTIAPRVDILMSNLCAICPDRKQVTVDNEQAAANEYLTAVAAQVRRSITNPNQDFPPPNQNCPTPLGWRRANGKNERESVFT